MSVCKNHSTVQVSKIANTLKRVGYFCFWKLISCIVDLVVYLPMSMCQRFWTKRLIMKCDTQSLESVFVYHVAPLQSSAMALLLKAHYRMMFDFT